MQNPALRHLGLLSLALAACVTLGAQSQQEAPSLDAEQRATQDQQRRDDEAHDRRVANRITGFLGLVGLFTFIVVGWQAWETRKAAVAARDSAATARDSLVMTHRPTIVVRNVHLPGITDADYSGGTIRVTNTGNTAARVIRFDSQWIFGSELPRRNPYATEDGRRRIVSKVIPAGTSQVFRLDPVNPDGNSIEFHRALHGMYVEGGVRLQLIGVIEYLDDLENLRRTGFCRLYNPQTGRFESVDDGDYEHAD